MNEERFARLEETVALLREEKASLVAGVDHLTSAVDKLNNTVETLNAAMNKGKGAVWTLVTVSGAAGALVTLFIDKLFGK